VTRRPHGKPLSLLIVRIEEYKGWVPQPLLAVFMSDQEDGLSVHRELLRRLYGLSRVQAEVAGQLMKGMTLEEIANQRGVRRSTVRSHVDQLFARTGTRRQTELVHFLLSSPARLLVE
jgi:DNA-binding CsgD family transcriptional regulator